MLSQVDPFHIAQQYRLSQKDFKSVQHMTHFDAPIPLTEKRNGKTLEKQQDLSGSFICGSCLRFKCALTVKLHTAACKELNPSTFGFQAECTFIFCDVRDRILCQIGLFFTPLNDQPRHTVAH